MMLRHALSISHYDKSFNRTPQARAFQNARACGVRLNDSLWIARGLCSAILIFAGLNLLGPIESFAEDSTIKIRHVFVPANRAKDWPKGEFEGYFEPVPFAEYEELRDATRAARPTRRGAHIPWQSLTATFDAGRGVLTDGRYLAEVRSESQQPQLMSLDPLDLPLSELRWADGDAVWGTAPSGETFLRVETPERRLEGKFSRQGRQLQRTWQFPLRLATATVTELKLRVPTKYSVKCSTGSLRGPLSTGEEGWRLWQVHLGSQSRCDVLVMESAAVVPTEPVVVYDQTSSYSLREADVEVQCEINAEIFHTPKATLNFTVPDDLAVYTVGFVGDSRLPWRELPRTPGQPRQIEVVLPQPQIGKVRSLQIFAGVAAKWDSAWTLPRIVLAGGWFNGGRWNVSVDAPLVWNELRTNGLRLTEVDVNTPKVRRLSFSQYLADAALSLDISYPLPRHSARSLQRLTTDGNDWQLTCEWLSQSVSGVTHAVRCRVPAGWEILDVRKMFETESSAVVHWNLITELSGERTLVCDFASPLEARSSQRIRVDAQRPRKLHDRRDAFELPTPLDCLHVDQLLVVTVPGGWKWDAADDAAPAATSMKRFVEPWSSFELWKSGSTKWGEATLLSRSQQNNTPLKPIAAFVLEDLVGGERAATADSASASDSVSGKALGAGNSPANVDLESPVASAKPLKASAIELTPPRAPAVPTDVERAERDQQLVWTSAELRSLIFPGSDGDDRHWLSLRTAEVTQVGRLEFTLPAPAELVSVKMNGVRTEPQRNDREFRLPSIPQGGLQTLEIQYRVPSDRDFLRNRESFPIPRLESPVLGFHWLVALPPEARLAEEPVGLRLLQPLDPTPWIRRLFGPLGRDEFSAWFNPFSRRSWKELWTPIDRREPLADLPATWFAPRGWRVLEAASPTLPAEITWVTWNANQVRIIAWMGMLFSIVVGCVMRCRQSAPRVHIAAMWLGACVVGVVLSSPVYAEGLGGCLIGTVIAVLIPRRLLMSYATRREASARGAFEVTVAIQRAGGMLVLSLLLTWAAYAVEDPKSSGPPRPSESRETAAQRFDVLIPVDDPRDALADVVRPSETIPMAWVPTPLLAIWRDQRARQASPATLLASAQYTVEISEQLASVKAEFLVHRLRPEQATTLLFPFANIPLSGAAACLLDGQPYSQFSLTKEGTLQFDLPAREPIQSDDGTSKVMTQRITVSLLPRLQTEDSVARVKLSLPPVLNSLMLVKSPPKSELVVVGRRGESQVHSDGENWSARLGKIRELSLEVHRPGVIRTRRAAGAKLDVACLAEVTPSALRQRYHAHYSVSSGEMNDVVWSLPRGVLIREGDVQADDLLQWSVEPSSDNRQRLVIEFSKPQTGDFSVDVAGLQPPLGTPEQPRWEPWTIELPADEADKASNVTKLKLGVTGLPGFKVTAQPLNAEHTAPLAESAFAKSWGNAPIAKSPQLLMQLSKPVELLFQVTPLVAQRKVRQELLLKLGRKSFEWELYAEVTTTGAPAFQHDLLLSPHFRVDEVKVTEDEADRLVSWAINDQRLTVFLRGETTGIQNISLQGRDAIPADGHLSIPTRWLADAEVSDFSVRVTHDPEWQAQVFDDRDEVLAPVEIGSPIPDRPELFLGKFRAKPASELLHLRLTPHQAAGAADAWTVVAPSTNDLWQWRHVERLLDRGQTTARIFWPSAWQTQGTFRLSPSLKELARRPLPDGFELTVQSVEESAAERELIFETQVPMSNLASLRLSPPTALDMGERTHQWLVAGELASWLPPQNDARPLPDTAALPESAKRLLPTTVKTWLQLVPTTPTLDMHKPEPPASAPEPKMVWGNTTVWVADGTISQGRTWLLLQPNGLRQLALRRPEGIHWSAAFVNDRLQKLPEELNVDLLIAELPNEPLLWISIFWQIDAAPRDRIVARRDAQLPTPVDAKLAPPNPDLTLISVGHSELSSTRGARRVQDWDGRLTRASHILRGLQSSPKSAHGSLRRLRDLIQTDITESRRMIEQLPSEVGMGHSARELLKAVTADFEALKARDQQLVLESGKTTTDQTWTSDAWLQIPKSWNAVADADPSASLSVIVVDRRWLTWTLAILAISAVIPLLRTWLRWQTGEWLARHPNLAWALLALIWWTCLVPSVIGFGLLVLATLTALRQRERAVANPHVA